MGSEVTVEEAQRTVEEEEPGESSAKRARTGTLSVAWADLEFEEAPNAPEVVGQGADVQIDSGRLACTAARCDHCDRRFESRNAFFHHLISVGIVPERQGLMSVEKGPIKKTKYVGVISGRTWNPGVSMMSNTGSNGFAQPGAPQRASVSSTLRSPVGSDLSSLLYCWRVIPVNV